jgi:hypothetical protein
MQATVDLPDSLYRRSAEIAAARGATIEQLIVDAITKEVLSSPESAGKHEVELPLIRSKNPGSLDLSHFDFDDLLA